MLTLEQRAASKSEAVKSATWPRVTEVLLIPALKTFDLQKRGHQEVRVLQRSLDGSEAAHVACT